MNEARILLIRHAESVPDPKQPEPDWPLSAQGERQAQGLVGKLVDEKILAIYSSPYPRALATVQPLSNARTMTTVIREDLRERKLSDERVDGRRELIARSWRDFDFAMQGGESFNDCQRRMRACIDSIAHAHQGETIVACSHGNAIALFLNSIDARFRPRSMGGHEKPQCFSPDVYGEWLDLAR